MRLDGFLESEIERFCDIDLELGISNKKSDKTNSIILKMMYEKHLNEGINVTNGDKKNPGKVSYDQTHDRNVDTGEFREIPFEPLRSFMNVDFCGSIVKFPLITLFGRYTGEEKNDKGVDDGNPLIYALKKEDYEFLSNYDEDKVWESIEKVCLKINQHFDTIICVHSTNEFLKKFVAFVAKYFKLKPVVDVFKKFTNADVYEGCLETRYFEQVAKEKGMDPAFVENDLTDILMNPSNQNKLFKYHKTFDNKHAYLRECVSQTMFLCKECIASSDDYGNLFKNKRVLIVDDIISRGKTMAEACQILQSNFNSKVTALTLMGRKANTSFEITRKDRKI